MSVDIAYVGTQSRQQPAPDRPQRHPLRRDVPAREPGPDALRRRRAGRGADAAGGARGGRPDLQRRDAAQRQPAAALRRATAACGRALFDSKASFNSLQAVGAAPLLARPQLRRLLHAVAGQDRLRRRRRRHLARSISPAYDYALANFDRTHYFVANYVWNVPGGSRLLGGGLLARGLLDNWTLSGISWISSGNPAELGLSISGINVDQPPRSAPTRADSRATCSRASASRAIRRARPTRSTWRAIQVPGVGDRGPYDRFYLRNPGFNNHDLSVFKNFPLAGRQRVALSPVPPGDVQRPQPHAVLGREPDDQPDQRRRPDRRGDPQRLHEPRDHQQPAARRRDASPSAPSSASTTPCGTRASSRWA